MSLFSSDPPPDSPGDPHGNVQAAALVVQPQTNGLGIASFVCALVGLFFTGGLLCPIAVILGLIALGRAPRGFAIAGLILGLLGSCGWVLAFLLFGAAILAMLGIAVAAVALTETEKVEMTSDMVTMAIAVKGYETENGYLPATLDDLGLKSTTMSDPWGRPYGYHLLDERPGFDIVSPGADGVHGTADDVRLTTLGEAWKAGGVGFDVEEDASSGSVTISLGGRSVTARGDDEHGRLTIDLGDRTIEIVGDEDGGSIDVVPSSQPGDPPDPPDAPAPPDAPDPADPDG
jgi:hypothetical protein